MAFARSHGAAALVVLALLVALGTTPPAAAVDEISDYVGSSTPCRFRVVRTGTATQVTGSCSCGSTTCPISLTGTVDPDTGAFSGTGSVAGLCADLSCSGTNDGEELHGTCTSSTDACNIGLSATKCGNGVIDPLEDCEDGNHADGDCCSARCRRDAAGTACTTDRSAACSVGVCNT